MKAVLDHLVISAEALDDGVARVEEALGVALGPGGQHAVMGTHNRLLGLGPVYLEVIAIDPDAAPPARPRWYDLDRFGGETRLTNWVLGVDDMKSALAQQSALEADIIEVTRGDLEWLMAVPGDGALPFDGTFPALIQWKGPHPVDRLEDAGCRLMAFEISHPEGAALKAALASLGIPAPIEISGGPIGYRAEIATPHGLRELTG